MRIKSDKHIYPSVIARFIMGLLLRNSRARMRAVRWLVRQLVREESVDPCSTDVMNHEHVLRAVVVSLQATYPEEAPVHMKSQLRDALGRALEEVRWHGDDLFVDYHSGFTLPYGRMGK